MKKKITIEQTFCDECGKSECFYSCLKCGKDFCYKCVETLAKKYSHAVYFTGSGDGVYCLKCDEILRNKGDKLHTIYRKIESFNDPYIKELILKNTIVTGGSIASMLLKEPINDYDIYFSKKQYLLMKNEKN
jgi:hypothetical protein